jgi:hypothetical protein
MSAADVRSTMSLAMRSFGMVLALALPAQNAFAEAPTIVLTGPGEVDEGAAFSVRAEVADPDGDAVTFSWDLDGDGFFGEAEDQAEASVPAGRTDGPGTFIVALEARAGVDRVSQTVRIPIRNVPPRFTVTPESKTRVGVQYQVDVRASDPAGSRDQLTYQLLDGENEAVLVGSVLLWTPSEPTDLGVPAGFVVAVSDGDAATRLAWSVVVVTNHPPTAPPIEYPASGAVLLERMPRLVVLNASDSDGDVIQYRFELGIDPKFEAAPQAMSGAIEEGVGYTAFALEDELAPGTYWWRAWAADEMSESEPAVGSFVVVDAPMVVDAGSVIMSDAGAESPAPSGSGCSASGARNESWLLLLSLAPLALWRRSRRVN